MSMRGFTEETVSPIQFDRESFTRRGTEISVTVRVARLYQPFFELVTIRWFSTEKTLRDTICINIGSGLVRLRIHECLRESRFHSSTLRDALQISNDITREIALRLNSAVFGAPVMISTVDGRQYLNYGRSLLPNPSICRRHTPYPTSSRRYDLPPKGHVVTVDRIMSNYRDTYTKGTRSSSWRTSRVKRAVAFPVLSKIAFLAQRSQLPRPKKGLSS